MDVRAQNPVALLRSERAPLNPYTAPVVVGVAFGIAPLLAAVRRPWASTVIDAKVYGPGVTDVFASAIVPVVVIVPPVNPVPAVIEVTPPPPPPVAVIVIFPVELSREIPGPALSESTPVFVTRTLPVVADTLMPNPALMSVTPPPPVEVSVPVL
jgi:hypothetical protein